MSRSRALELLALAGMVTTLVAATPDARANPATAQCKPGAVAASVGGRVTCLRSGMRCKAKLAREYALHGLVCRRGKLVYRVPARVVARIPVGGAGAVAAGLDSVWVIDRADGVLDPNGTPVGSLYKIDPASNTVSDRIPGVIGAAIAFGDGDAWVPSPLLNRLLRVDPDTHAIERIATGPSADEYPYGAVAAAGGVWVANHHAGTVVRVDTETNAVDATIIWGEPQPGGPQHLATDGTTVHVVGSLGSAVLNIDAVRRREWGRADVAPAGTCGGIDMDERTRWIASGFDLPYGCWQRSAWAVTRIDFPTGIRHFDAGGARPVDVKLAFGSVWVLTDYPNTSLYRLDPVSGRVLGRLRLSGYPDFANPLAVGFGSLWVRLAEGWGVDPRYAIPTHPTSNAGELLRIDPLP